MRYYLKLFSILALALTLPSGCAKKQEENEFQKIENSSTLFFSSPQKLRSTLNCKEPEITAIFEGYIDTNGNGNGLLEVGEVVREVTISDNNLIVTVLDKTYAVEDIGPYFSFYVFSDLQSNWNSLRTAGGKISGLSGVENGVVFNTEYQECDDTFQPDTKTIDETITLKELLELLATVNSEKSDSSAAIGTLAMKDDKASEEIDGPKEPSFYLRSPLGINIDGNIYSIGDKVNVNDYYKEMVPEGISYDTVWDSVNKIETVTTSYLDTTGKLSVVTIDDIVFEMSTTTDFKFLDTYKGMSQKELKSLLGIGLSKKDLETFTPMYEGMKVIKSTGKIIKCSIGSLTVEFVIKGQNLSTIYLTEDRGYLHYDS